MRSSLLQDFILVAALHSLSKRHPDRIEKSDGYLALAVINAVSMVSTVFAPVLSNHCNSKWICLIGVLCATIYFITFQYFERWIFFAACAVFGVGLSIFNAGEDASLLELSTIKTLYHNYSIESIIDSLGIFLSGIIYILITIMYNNEGIATDYRSYCDLEITHFYQTFVIICGISMCMFAFLKEEEVEGNISSLDIPHKTWTGQISALLIILVEGRILMIVPFFLYTSLFDTLWVTIIPTTLHYIDSLSEYIYITAYFSMSFAIGSLITSFIILNVSKQFEDFALRPLMVFSAIAQLIIYAWMVLMIPKESSIEPTNQPSLLVQPRLVLLLALAALFGFASTANKMTRTVLCGRLFPNRKHQVFGAARFYTSLAASVVFFASPDLNIFAYASGLVVLLGVAIVSFLYTASRVKMYEKNVDEDFPTLDRPPKAVAFPLLDRPPSAAHVSIMDSKASRNQPLLRSLRQEPRYKRPDTRGGGVSRVNYSPVTQSCSPNYGRPPNYGQPHFFPPSPIAHHSRFHSS